ncbi:GIY-YIG nuclease family protein [Clostridium botulinum]|nr:GIY-YIG nuclease family protein [Clostridium botulinum]NEZ86227.1 GIY-YIG nuclease family protein [Clostridium botulinum]NFB01078.1 GIY-YIG nuclease family protein [Clostridium botulinum]NFE31638.1 GIY-YIG nuclease family protein [Clostridium botulinum]NFM30387.1 GIY-YIG nuclease family protein [Clostridium botulinum]
MDIKSGIYMIYNKVNQQVYIGQAVNIENRLKLQCKD